MEKNYKNIPLLIPRARSLPRNEDAGPSLPRGTPPLPRPSARSRAAATRVRRGHAGLRCGMDQICVHARPDHARPDHACVHVHACTARSRAAGLRDRAVPRSWSAGPTQWLRLTAGASRCRMDGLQDHQSHGMVVRDRLGSV